MVQNNSKIQAIVSAHRDETLAMFKADAPASKMVALRMKNALKSSMVMSALKLSPSLPSLLQELLVKAEEEAMILFQIVTAHRDEALRMFKADSPASKMVSLRMEHVSAMKSSMASLPSSKLQELLVKSEEEAMGLFQREISFSTNDYPVTTNEESERTDHDMGFVGEETNGIQYATAADYKNDDFVSDELSKPSDKPPRNASETKVSLDLDRSNQSGAGASSLEGTLSQTEPSVSPTDSFDIDDTLDHLQGKDTEDSTIASRSSSASLSASSIFSESMDIAPSSKSTVSTTSRESKSISCEKQVSNAVDIIRQRDITYQSTPRVSSESSTINPPNKYVVPPSSRKPAKKKLAKSNTKNKHVSLSQSAIDATSKNIQKSCSSELLTDTPSAKSLVHPSSRNSAKKTRAKQSNSKSKPPSSFPPAIDVPDISGPCLDALSKKDLKPLLNVGEKVYAGWWQDKQRESSTLWYPGIVKSYKEVETGGQYGPLRLYDIAYDDGDELGGVEDACVYPRQDFELLYGESNLIGVVNVVDGESSDRWASTMGWYNVTTNGTVKSFSYLSDALRASESNRNDLVSKKCSSEDDAMGLASPQQSNTYNAEQVADSGNTSSSSSSSNDDSSNDSDDDDDDDEDDGLSEYERFRERNIKRNKERLAHLGLLANATTTPTTSAGCAAGRNRSSLTNLLTSNDTTRTKQPRKRKTAVPTPRRSLPRRRCTKQGFSYNNTPGDNVVGRDLEESPPASNADSQNGEVVVLNKEDGSSNGTIAVLRGPSEKQTLAGVASKHSQGKIVPISDLRGCYLNSNKKSYMAKIYYQKKQRCLGSYALASDAALAYDLALKMTNGSNRRPANFATEQDHRITRASELNTTGLVVDLDDTLALISSKVNLAMNKISGESKDDVVRAGIPKSQDGAKCMPQLRGNFWNKVKSKYQSMIRYQGKCYYIGAYALEADAALAYDLASKMLQGSSINLRCLLVPNFAHEQDHIDTREKEMRATGLDVDFDETFADISSRVKGFATKIGALTAPVASNSDESRNTTGSSGCSITAKAMAAIESYVNNTISKIYSPKKVLVDKDSRSSLHRKRS